MENGTQNDQCLPQGRGIPAANATPSISFEFFPPKTEDASEKLFRSIESMIPLKPAFVSVTCGAGGTTRQLTHELVLRIHQRIGLPVVPHLTCVGSTRDEIRRIVGEYVDQGICTLLALRGDLPQGADPALLREGDFPYALDLIRFIRESYPEVRMGAACYPEGHRETPNRLVEVDLLKQKVDAGVSWLVTQMFFDNHEYYDFVARCRMQGVKVPILAGIMPITSRKGMEKMADLSPGTRFPAPLLQAIYGARDEEQVKQAGIQWTTRQVMDLLDRKADGIHFYTLNKSKPTLTIHAHLGLPGGHAGC